MSLSASQRQAVAQFRDMTNCSESSAQKYLRSTRYNVEAAVDAYLRKHSASVPKVDTKQLDRIFSAYCDAPEGDEIGIEGTMRYLGDIDLPLDEVGVLGLAMQLGAPTQGVFTRPGFVKGWQALGVSSLDGMKRHARTLTPALRPGASTTADADFFKRTYLYTFTFALTPPSRTLPLDAALVFWDLLLAGRFSRLEGWKTFMTAKGRGVSRDVWNLLLDFCQTVGHDLADYDETEAWPVVIDDFVAWCKENDA